MGVSLESMDILGTIPQYHIILEAFILAWTTWFIVKKYYNRSGSIPSDDEVQRKLAEWRPEPLVTNVEEYHGSLHPICITSKVGKMITINRKECLNLGTHNYLGFLENKEIEDKAISTIKKYGVGSCGPRGFYGTVDVHLELEERLAIFTGTEEAVVYSYGFSTVASAIPAYCKRNDIVFVDEKVNFAIQKGLDASRSNVRYFKHNNINNLEVLLQEQAKKDENNFTKAVRTKRFLIVEGIYANTGTLCPLPELIKLCRKYKLRLFVDESISFGTIGNNGRGVTEHFNVPKHEIDLIIGSLETALGSIGGFCVGSSFIIDHQRLSGLGYCFSASLPPFLTTSAIKSLDIMTENPQLFQKLKENCLEVDRRLKELESLECSSFPESPVKHLYLKRQLDRAAEYNTLSTIAEKCMEKKLAVTCPAYLAAEKTLPRHSLKLCISAVLNRKDIDFALQTLETCIMEVIS